jgi:hypothetical protein
MTSSASSATWLPAAIAGAAVLTPPAQAVPVEGGHSTPGFVEVMEAVAAELDLGSRGRHAEPEWSRELYDPRRDDDPLDWLGFADQH